MKRDRARTRIRGVIFALGLSITMPNSRAANPDSPGSPIATKEPSPPQIEFFETKIRPILINNCQKCHGAQKHQGGLRLDSRDAALKGGESGPAVIPGNPQGSPMIDAVNYRGLEMPPTGKLKEREIAALTEWIKIGAPWPKTGPARSKGDGLAGRSSDFAITDEDRRYWAYRPVGHPSPPSVTDRDWPLNPIDEFVLSRLEQKGLRPNAAADPRSLVRRVYFDLIGLPPTPEQVDAFVVDPSPANYERIVDDLLGRKEYGERWGRHWLDVVRFAQTNGYERDAEKPEAWRYRDYVIGSLNDDKPFNQFVIEQLAGDELENPTRDSIVATGIYRLGVWDDEPDNAKAAAWDEIDEMVRTTGAAFLGLTLGCARCHNHMFDPISQEDYYRFAAFFRNVEPYGVSISPTHRKANDDGIFIPLGSPKEFADWKARQRDLAKDMADLKTRLDSIRKAGSDRLIAKGVRNPSRREASEALTASERETKTRLERKLARLERNLRNPPFPRALCVRECGPPLRETRVLVRGNVDTPGRLVDPRLPTVLGGQRIEAIPSSHHDRRPQEGSLRPMLAELGIRPTLGLRLQLARWVASDKNPLTARVIMNRLWQHHFGRGIVRSSDDFGRAGTPPTHPELLEWLARDFMDGGWKLKRMHKAMVLSATYRMSSSTDNHQAIALDAENELLWRQNLRRLDAESIRDSILAVAGDLNPAMGGRGIFPALSPEVLATQSRPGFGWDKSTPEEQARRSVYIFLKRTLMVPFLETFDYTNTAESLAARPVTTVAPQALLLLNSEFANRQARVLAARIRREAGKKPDQQTNRLFRLTLDRSPTPRELGIARRLLEQSQTKASNDKSPAVAKLDPLESLCLVVLNLNEFVYID